MCRNPRELRVETSDPVVQHTDLATRGIAVPGAEQAQ